MVDGQRQRFNIRVIRVTLDAALRKASSPEVAHDAVARALGLLDGVRRDAVSAQVRAEAESARTEIAHRAGEARWQERRSP